jgi:hypothetical protein
MAVAPTRHRVTLATTLAKDALRVFRSCHTGAGPCPAAHRAGDYSETLTTVVIPLCHNT